MAGPYKSLRIEWLWNDREGVLRVLTSREEKCNIPRPSVERPAAEPLTEICLQAGSRHICRIGRKGL
jgi:hypothetical protein